MHVECFTFVNCGERKRFKPSPRKCDICLYIVVYPFSFGHCVVCPLKNGVYLVLPWSRDKIEKSSSPKLTDYFIQGVRKYEVKLLD